MSDKSPNLATLASSIKVGIEGALKELHTALPGTIVSFNAAKQTASIQPAIKRIFRKDTGEDIELTPTALPTLINVPVQFPRGGGFSLTFPIVKGDECLVVFCERSIDRWHKFSGIQEPGARRFHDLSDGTCFVGLSSEPNKVPNYDANNVQLKSDDGKASLTVKPTALELKADADIVAIAGGNLTGTAGGTADVTAIVSASITAPVIALNGNVIINGSLTSNSSDGTGEINFSASKILHDGKEIGNAHGHTQGADSNGDTEAVISGVT